MEKSNITYPDEYHLFIQMAQDVNLQMKAEKFQIHVQKYGGCGTWQGVFDEQKLNAIQANKNVNNNNNNNNNMNNNSWNNEMDSVSVYNDENIFYSNAKPVISDTGISCAPSLPHSKALNEQIKCINNNNNNSINEKDENNEKEEKNEEKDEKNEEKDEKKDEKDESKMPTIPHAFAETEFAFENEIVQRHISSLQKNEQNAIIIKRYEHFMDQIQNVKNNIDKCTNLDGIKVQIKNILGLIKIIIDDSYGYCN